MGERAAAAGGEALHLQIKAHPVAPAPVCRGGGDGDGGWRLLVSHVFVFLPLLERENSPT